MVAYRVRSDDYGSADVVAVPIGVVAVPPVGISDQLRVWQDVVFGLRRLGT